MRFLPALLYILSTLTLFLMPKIHHHTDQDKLLTGDEGMNMRLDIIYTAIQTHWCIDVYE